MNAVGKLLFPYREAASQFWQVRDMRERRLLTLGAAAIVLALVYLSAIDPALSGRESLKKTLPPLRQQAAQMQAMANQVEAASEQEAPQVESLTRESLEASLTRAGLKAQNVNVGDRLMTLQFANVPFSNLLRWLEEAQRASLLTVLESNILALNQADMVNATLILRQQKDE
jgi:general secretion pathway protein M